LLELMLETVSAGLRDLDSAIASRDHAQIAWEAHSLKGTLLNGGARDLGKACQELIALARRADFPAIHEAHRLIAEQCEQLKQDVARHLETLAATIAG